MKVGEKHRRYVVLNWCRGEARREAKMERSANWAVAFHSNHRSEGAGCHV